MKIENFRSTAEGRGQRVRFYSLAQSISQLVCCSVIFVSKYLPFHAWWRFMYADMCTDKVIWICKQMIRWMWASARTRMQFENGYVNRFCCRLFAAYFLPNGFASLFCNSFFASLFILRAVTVDSLFLCARQSFRSNRSKSLFSCYVWACLLNCCMFARKLKCNDIYYIFTYHGIQHSICDRLGTDIHTWHGSVLLLRMQISLLDFIFFQLWR